MSPLNPCRSCGTALQHCLEMRTEPDAPSTRCCSQCAQWAITESSPGLHVTEAERRARHLTPGAHRTVNNQRITAELRPGDTIRSGGPTVRTVRENVPPRPGSSWHVLIWEEGKTFWSQAGDTWELVSAATPPEVQYAVRNANGEIFPAPSRDWAQHVADGGAPDLEVVSRTVSPWEVLR